MRGDSVVPRFDSVLPSEKERESQRRLDGLLVCSRTHELSCNSQQDLRELSFQDERLKFRRLTVGFESLSFHPETRVEFEGCVEAWEGEREEKSGRERQGLTRTVWTHFASSRLGGRPSRDANSLSWT